MKPTLFLLAAGMGSRYGGLKQLDGLGPNGMPDRNIRPTFFCYKSSCSKSADGVHFRCHGA